MTSAISNSNYYYGFNFLTTMIIKNTKKMYYHMKEELKHFRFRVASIFHRWKDIDANSKSSSDVAFRISFPEFAIV